MNGVPSSYRPVYRPVLLPVLDVRGGIAVHAVAGERDRYRPLRTPLCESPDPLAVARAVRGRFGSDGVYLADLDALAGRPPNRGVWRALAADGFAVTLDPGVRGGGEVADTLAVPGDAGRVVAATETLAGPAALAAAVRAGGERVLFGLDLRGGRLRGADDDAAAAWGTPEHAVRVAAETGVAGVLVLDTAAVGTGRGVPTLPLCRTLRAAFPGLRLLTGGGVRGPADVTAAGEAGVDELLVATALHDGRLP